MQSATPLPGRVIFIYALGQLGWSLNSYAVGNLLVYFYMPPEQGVQDIPTFVYAGAVFGVFTLIGVLSAAGRLFDALIDPAIANWSDRKQSKWGKRRWFLRWGAFPFALFSLLIFLPPMEGENAGNLVWLFACLALYYFFFAFYVIPYTALIAELGHTPSERLRISTAISITWAVGFVAGSSAFALQGYFESLGLSPVSAFQRAIMLLSGIAFLLMLTPALLLDENKYVRPASSEAGIWKAIRSVIRNRNFRIFLLSDLLYWLALTFIQLGVIYYTTLLIGLDKSEASVFSLISFLMSFLWYWPVNYLSGKMGKRQLMLFAFLCFAIIFAVVSFARFYSFLGVWLLYGLAVCAAFPLAVFGILPNAIIGDEVEREARERGTQFSGMYFGMRALVMKIGISIANLIFPSLLLLGKSAGNALGVELSALLAIGFSVAGWWVFRSYEERN